MNMSLTNNNLSQLGTVGHYNPLVKILNWLLIPPMLVTLIVLMSDETYCFKSAAYDRFSKTFHAILSTLRVFARRLLRDGKKSSLIRSRCQI